MFVSVSVLLGRRNLFLLVEAYFILDCNCNLQSLFFYYVLWLHSHCNLQVNLRYARLYKLSHLFLLEKNKNFSIFQILFRIVYNLCDRNLRTLAALIASENKFSLIRLHNFCNNKMLYECLTTNKKEL